MSWTHQIVSLGWDAEVSYFHRRGNCREGAQDPFRSYCDSESNLGFLAPVSERHPLPSLCTPYQHPLFSVAAASRRPRSFNAFL